MMPVRNEADRYLVRTLSALERLVDAIVVYDDASSDATAEVCTSFPKVELYRGDSPLLAVDEAGLRERLWRLAVARDPEWILALDADEELDERAVGELWRLFDQRDYDVISCRIFDFWKSETHVRVDGPWNPWNRFSPVAVRCIPALSDTWNPQPIHCGRFPRAYADRSTFYSQLRVRHYGWARQEDHLRKYLFYRERDLTLHGKVAAHTESILSAKIRLEPWLVQRPAPWLEESREG